ncbi:hypothetical protein ABPG74_016672 [Tetrahymena malaccensis]
MDIKLVKEFENFVNQIQPTLSKIEKQYNNQAVAIEKSCLNKANNQESKFVECMIKNSDAYQKAFKSLEYHINYWKNTTFLCFQKTPNDLTSCKQEASKTLEQYIHKCFKDI